MSETAITASADAIATARLSLTPLAPPSAGATPRDLAEAYAVRDAVHARLAESRFGARIGWKIGCTTPVMQAYLGIAHPCAAGLFAGTTHRGDARLRHGDFVKVGVECEIAVRLTSDLPEGPFTTESVRSAVGAVMAAIEIVDDRYVEWQGTGTPMLVADDFFAAGAVLGREHDPAALPDLATLRGRVLIDGVEAGAGIGADVLGHPYAALAWLAEHASERRMPLRAGETVLLGSLVRTQWVSAGASVRIEIDALGAVEANFA
ncbi:2-oxo-3-hexenedioate decarboxylase [Bosea sp. 62]|uniref:2-keto-4-pentenoate hydratase n=1 Tax=unclassified Bosea (in: a-proteobacteria) TaxID=2653178 RepID=UPI00125C7E79|nr:MULTISPECIES: fumarylacetoacetate hydrolase family protein [unclassified Bosea (in: a-proteobacteria)]CAD5252118.1 2-oxo-3-hexenedioate decarboxylase [Bosea sp. 7B]CAD5279449.1 2-oxo-3-hexenedioate decarboxylase [Bosea sp. 21B]CAD5280592.1 2-oxo-3-hexenedioate decarboxylase [Bosea sp. 46]VVT59539.1 2-oxo-3-hexenedioate decarboxylase [Bosea sp. EC-HK365B]VXB33095.1 2-oxo-3-hexenedioate decarboxylase [Bosea sp. 62]